MHPFLRNVLAVLAGLVVGSLVNMGLVQLGYQIYPLEGVDVNDMEAMAAAMPNLEAKHFIFPFLAHALGTLVGAMLAARLAAGRPLINALIVGAFFLLGGIMASSMLPAPVWFITVDLLFAYLPMAWLGARLAGAKTANP